VAFRRSTTPPMAWVPMRNVRVPIRNDRAVLKICFRRLVCRGLHERGDLFAPFYGHVLAGYTQQKSGSLVVLADDFAGRSLAECFGELYKRMDRVILDTQSVARFVF